jgi:hypothetical protein
VNATRRTRDLTLGKKAKVNGKEVDFNGDEQRKSHGESDARRRERTTRRRGICVFYIHYGKASIFCDGYFDFGDFGEFVRSNIGYFDFGERKGSAGKGIEEAAKEDIGIDFGKMNQAQMAKMMEKVWESSGVKGYGSRFRVQIDLLRQPATG